MTERKWPTVAKVVVALGVLGATRDLALGLFDKDLIRLLDGLTMLIIWRGLYYWRRWAPVALNVVLGFTIIANIAAIFTTPAISLTSQVIQLTGIVYLGYVLVYFNSTDIKRLFSMTENA